MKIVIAGASGLIGKSLHVALKKLGNQVLTLVRKEAEASNEAIFWNPKTGEVDLSSLENSDAIINLAGENIFSKRWTDAQKKKILESRMETTTSLVQSIHSLKFPPKVLINASAIGYYGDRGEEICTEKTSPGSGFLADVCVKWEDAASKAKKLGVRTVFLRTGVVLAKEEGALAKMLPVFKWGFGGKLGSGKQYMSWVSIDDIVNIILFALQNEKIEGPLNGVSPLPVTNQEFTKTLGDVLKRPTFFSVPSLALEVLLGKEMAKEMLLASIRVQPKKLLENGYSFRHSTLSACLNEMIRLLA